MKKEFDKDILIDITGPTFQIDPDERFSKSMKVPRGFWNNMYQKHKFWGYKQTELREWFNFKTKRTISRNSVDRWIVRHEMFIDATKAVKKGYKSINLGFFRRNHDYLVKFRVK